MAIGDAYGQRLLWIIFAFSNSCQFPYEGACTVQRLHVVNLDQFLCLSFVTFATILEQFIDLLIVYVIGCQVKLKAKTISQSINCSSIIVNVTYFGAQ